MKPSVLIAAPVSEKKDYVCDEWLDHLMQIFHHDLDFYFVDNSRNPHYHKKFHKRGLFCDHIEPKGVASAFIAESQNKIREYFLAGSWTHLWLIEEDTFVEPWFLPLLLSYGTANINITYFIKTEHRTTLSLQEIVVKGYGTSEAKVIEPMKAFCNFNGKIQKYFAPGIGCTLIERRVMEKIKFRVKENAPSKFSDSFFHLDCNREKFTPYVYMGALCVHKRQDWAANLDTFLKV